ncbi:MAG TPA: prolyl oligopeptidase family serine peptidase [Acidimicrobiia bacterium]
MQRFSGLLVVLVLAGPALLPLGEQPGGASEPGGGYPPTRTEDVVEDIHGVPVADPYRWLEDATSAEVQAWMRDQDGFARHQLGKLGGRQRLAERLRQVLYVDSVSVPSRYGARSFFTRRQADQEKAVLYWRGRDGADHVLIDPNTLSADGSTSLGEWVPSYDGKTLAYALSENNADEATLHLKDVASGRVSDVDRIEGAKYARPSWTPYGDGFYYVWLPTDPSIPVAERPGHAEVRFHVLGTDPDRDPVIRERTGDPEKFVWTHLSRDGHWLFSGLSNYTRDDLYFRDLRHPDSPWRTLVEGVEANFWVEAWEDRFYVTTNDGASRWRVLRADPAAPDRRQWAEIVPEARDAVLQDASVVGGRLALNYLRDAANQIEIRTLDGAKVCTVPLPGIGSSSGIEGNPDEDEAYFSFNSFTTTPEIYRTSIQSGTTERWSKVAVPVDSGPYTVEQVFYSSKDGTRVPMFLVHRKDLPRDGSTPFLLYGYGGFAVNMQPTFRGALYPWLEAGGGFAVANLRGGSEYGEDWHRAGMLSNKQNVFDDFIAAAQHLVAQGYTRPEHLAIHGRSNGGLLMGAALTQRPDLFRAVICEVPLLDVVRYHLFGSGRTWVSEYGSAERKEDFGWLYAYSPYHHVKADTAYPAVLFGSSDSDDRVDPLHARKMTAALQAASTGGPVLLRIEAHAGHGGADLVRSTVEEFTDYYAFLIDQLGMTPPG